MSHCRSCGASVVWVETEATERKTPKLMPLDADTDGQPLAGVNGNLAIVGKLPSGTPIVRVTNGGPYLSHFATCPNAKEWRR